MKRTLLFLLLATYALSGFAQGELPVSMYTGTPGISVKLHTLTDHDLSETISLSYSTTGLNLNSTPTYGVGWSMDVGGQISREVRGLPDDFKGGAGDTRRGWLYNNNCFTTPGFPNSADLSTSTCSDEQADNAFISALNDNADTEPDLFSFSVGGITGHFVFNNTGTTITPAISLIPYQDVSIVPVYKAKTNDPNTTDLTIVGWTITTNAGIIYTFNQAAAASKFVTKQNNSNPVTISNREYNLYSVDNSNPPVLYSSAWMLSTTTSPTGASLTYSYTSTPVYSSFWKVFSLFKPGTPATRTSFYLMMVYTTSTNWTITRIATSNNGPSAQFTGNTDIAIFDPNRSPFVSFKRFTLGYGSNFLTSITESDDNHCTQMPPYKFYYSNSSGNFIPNYPGTGSTSQDFWGYYNGASNSSSSYTPTIYVYPNEPANERYRIYPIPSYNGTAITLPGSGDRMPNADAILSGSLSRIVYPTGGETDLTFEPNKYYDARAGIDQLGGGLRLKSAVYFDGVNPAAAITKNFSYVDASGHSSGRLVNMPVFALPLWQFQDGTTTTPYSTLVSQGTNNQWSGITAVSQYDMNPTEYTSGSAVGYTRVTVNRPNSGSAVFDYLVPATYGTAATGSGATDWTPTTMKFARPSGCPSMNEIQQAETWGYPSFPNAYYDYERGLLNKKWEYNNAGTLIRTTQENYQYLYKSGTQPTPVIGLAYDRFANSGDQTFPFGNPIFLYGRYSLLTDVAKVLSTETVITYDENNASQFSTEVTQYNFTSPYHKLVSRINKTTIDGTVYGTAFKYTLDYPVTTVPSDSTLNMIYLLKSANRNNTIIEQVYTVQPPSGTEKTTGASLVKFRPFSYNKPLLRSQLVFRPSTPVTDFAPSTVDGNYAFTSDPRYEVVNTINEYDLYDLPISATGEDKNTSGTLWGYGQQLPVASFNQARSISIGFSDFETTTGASFAIANEYDVQGRTGAKGVYPTATLSRTVVKPASASKYIFSFWLKNQTSTNVTLQYTFKDGGGSTLSTIPHTYSLTSNDYQYFTEVIDVSSFPSTFTIQVQGTGLAAYAGPNSLPMLDDVSFYPDYALIKSNTYDIPFGPNSTTDQSGMTLFTNYDLLGRTKLIIDQDHNIRKRLSYAATGQILPTTIVAFISGITASSKYETNTPIQFVATPLNCLTGVTYEWDFGSGYSSPSSSNLSPVQNYTTTGNQTVTVRVTHAIYGQKTYSMSFAINPPLSITLCPTGVQTMAAMQVTGSYNCYPNPNPSNWITCKVPGNPNDHSVWSYQWKEQRIGTTTWTNVLNNNTATYGRQVLWREGSFQISCTVTTSDGRTADSPPVLVTVTQTQ